MSQMWCCSDQLFDLTESDSPCLILSHDLSLVTFQCPSSVVLFVHNIIPPKHLHCDTGSIIKVCFLDTFLKYVQPCLRWYYTSILTLIEFQEPLNLGKDWFKRSWTCMDSIDKILWKHFLNLNWPMPSYLKINIIVFLLVVPILQSGFSCL